MRVYIDTSAAWKQIAEEPETDALSAYLRTADLSLVACGLLETELRRCVFRADGASQEDVTAILSSVNIYDITHAVLKQAGLLPGANLRSLDAIHLAAALSLAVDAVLTYDTSRGEAAATRGLPVVAPSTPTATRSSPS